MNPRRVFLLALATLQLLVAGVLWSDSAPVPDRDQQRRALLTVDQVLEGLEAQNIDVGKLDSEQGTALVSAIFKPVRAEIGELSARDRRPVQALVALGLALLVLALIPERPFGRRASAASGVPSER